MCYDKNASVRFCFAIRRTFWKAKKYFEPQDGESHCILAPLYVRDALHPRNKSKLTDTIVTTIVEVLGVHEVDLREYARTAHVYDAIVDPITWWKQLAPKYPALAPQAIFWLLSPVGNADLERVNSQFRIFCPPLRSGLTSENIAERVWLKTNLNLLDSDTDSELDDD